MDKMVVIGRIVLVLVVGLFFGFGISSGFAEDITLTTFYPSPYGVYQELRSKRIAIGDNYIDSDYCWGGGCAHVISPDTDLAVEGRVGIGVTSPNAPLEVDGEVRLSAHTDMGSNDASLATKKYVDDKLVGISCRHFKTTHHVVINGEAYSYAWCSSDEVRTGGGCSVSSGKHLVENHPVYSSGAKKGGWLCKRDDKWSVAAWVVCCKATEN